MSSFSQDQKSESLAFVANVSEPFICALAAWGLDTRVTLSLPVYTVRMRVRLQFLHVRSALGILSSKHLSGEQSFKPSNPIMLW